MAARDKNIRVASTRLAALVRHRTPDDPDVIEAARDLRAAQLNEHVQRVVDTFAPLTPEQRSRLAALLAGAGEADASRAAE
jgi:Spy/CpxP family protein refolding chaperone